MDFRAAMGKNVDLPWQDTVLKQIGFEGLGLGFARLGQRLACVPQVVPSM